MDNIKSIMGNGPTYLIGYLLFMTPTYVLPYFGSNSVAANSVLAAADASSNDVSGLNILLFVHLICLAALCLLAYIRGDLISKKWIVVFPILATFFDMMPGFNWIPLIPTFMHIAAIIVGVSGTRATSAI